MTTGLPFKNKELNASATGFATGIAFLFVHKVWNDVIQSGNHLSSSHALPKVLGYLAPGYMVVFGVLTLFFLVQQLIQKQPLQEKPVQPSFPRAALNISSEFIVLAFLIIVVKPFRAISVPAGTDISIIAKIFWTFVPLMPLSALLFNTAKAKQPIKSLFLFFSIISGLVLCGAIALSLVSNVF